MFAKALTSIMERKANKHLSLDEIKESVRLVNVVQNRIVILFNTCWSSDNLKRRILQEGKFGEKRGRARSPTRWSDQMKQFTGYTVTEASRKAENIS